MVEFCGPTISRELFVRSCVGVCFDSDYVLMGLGWVGVLSQLPTNQYHHIGWLQGQAVFCAVCFDFFCILQPGGGFLFFFASSTTQISRHDLWRQKCGPFVVIVRDWFFSGCVGEFVFFFAFVQIYLNLNLIGDIPSSVGVSLALCFVGGHIPRLRDKKLPRSAPLAVHVPPSFFYVTG